MIQAKDSSEIITEAFILKNKTKHWGVELSSLLAVQRGSFLSLNLEVLFVGRALYNKQLSQMCNRNLTHLSGNDGYFWDCGLCKSKKQFGSVSDDASVLLSCAC